MARIRNPNTGAELDVPDEAVPYFPDYEPVTEEKPHHVRKAAEPTTPKE